MMKYLTIFLFLMISGTLGPIMNATESTTNATTPAYSTYLGGNENDESTSITVDDEGCIYITGITSSLDFPVKNPFQDHLKATWSYGRDVFVVKLNPKGEPIYSTYLGGSDSEGAGGIAVDHDGHAFVTGYTVSKDFPMKHPLQPEIKLDKNGYGGDAFISKLTPDGDDLVFSTFLGGSLWEEGRRIKVDNEGAVYVCGVTDSPDFPTKNAFQSEIKTEWSYGSDLFITKLSPNGDELIYSTFLGGKNYENCWGFTVDKDGAAYITGLTSSDDFPVASPVQAKPAADQWGYAQDAFVTKLAPNGNALIYSTYLGGTEDDSGTDVAVDNEGHAYVTGFTRSAQFPTTNPLQQNQGGEDAFVTKFSPSGDQLIYSTYLGGSYNDNANSIDVDHTGAAYVTGHTGSIDFPTLHAFQPKLNVTDDAYSIDGFITKISNSGDQLIYSSFLGGKGNDRCSAVTVDHYGNAYVTGSTLSDDFPTQNAFQESRNGKYDVFVTKIRNNLLSLTVSRHQARTLLILKDYARIRITHQYSGNTPITAYVIYRKTDNGSYEIVKIIPAESPGNNEPGNNEPIEVVLEDLLPKRDQKYTYKAEALDENDNPFLFSKEHTI